MQELYRLTELLRAVHTSGDQVGLIAEIPPGSILIVIGEASIPGLTEVDCNGCRYALFYDDLLYRAEPILKARTA